MFTKSTLAIIAAITALAIASPALAQDGRTQPDGSHYSHSDPHSPALCGGGSVGYNRTLATLSGG